jgi:hypothetical protein
MLAGEFMARKKVKSRRTRQMERLAPGTSKCHPLPMKALLASLALLAASLAQAAAPYPDRFVWVFGWGLGNDRDLPEITKVLDTAGQSGLNGAMVSFGMDTLCKQSPDYFRQLAEVQKACDRNHLDLIPAIFSVGYAGGILSHDKNLAEGLPVLDAPFLVKGSEARLAPGTNGVRLANAGFDDFVGQKFKGWGFHDQPGEISFVDTEVRHGGRASLRMENFTANQHGHGRIMQEIQVQPRRCYRLNVWVKTENLVPASAFQVQVLAGERTLAPREFHLPATTDWRRLTLVFNSTTFAKVRLYAGVWGGKSGKYWLDDWSLEELGPLNVLHRPGTPVTVRSEDGATTFTAGKGYAPLVDPTFQHYQLERPAAPLKILAGGRITDGQRLRVSWYHSMVIHDSQITACMAEPALDEIFDHEARLLAEKVKPRRVMLNMDEVRMGGTCQACQGKNMGELIAQCVTRQAQALRRHIPGVQVYVWSDMFDPHHNAHGNYFLVEGDYTGSWQGLPKDLVVAVWGGAPREKSLRFFADHGFQTLVGCYYDADNLEDVKKWQALSLQTTGVRGFMYTPWQKKYGLLLEFGELLKQR